jgi:hypothetical protein
MWWWGSCGFNKTPFYEADIEAVDPALPSRGWWGSWGSNNIPLLVSDEEVVDKTTVPPLHVENIVNVACGSNNTATMCFIKTVDTISLPSCGGYVRCVVWIQHSNHVGSWGSWGSNNTPLYVADILAVDPAPPIKWLMVQAVDPTTFHVSHKSGSNTLITWAGEEAADSTTLPFM